MNKLMCVILALSFKVLPAHAEDYPRLAETKAGMIEKYEEAEKLYSGLIKYPGHFEYKYIEGDLCSKKNQHSKCVALSKSHEAALLPLFQALPLYLTQMRKAGLVSYVAFEECAGMQCVVDAVRYNAEPNIQHCDTNKAPKPNSECIVFVIGSWYIRYKFLGPKNA